MGHIADHLTEEASELTRSWKEWTETEFGRARRFNDVVAWLEAHGLPERHLPPQCRRETPPDDRLVWNRMDGPSAGRRRRTPYDESPPTPEEIAP